MKLSARLLALAKRHPVVMDSKRMAIHIRETRRISLGSQRFCCNGFASIGA
jgi:hypothetical protein